MAERVVSVRLKALIDDYKRAMGQAGQATADVAKKADNWTRMGQSMSSLGDRMTRNVTLPILAVGAAAVKMASDFDAAFVQMQTLAGVSGDEVDALKESVLGLAGETGKAPQELAEALYFIQSAGLSGQVALDALEASAKGAAAGLGSTIQVADAVTNALNGYGTANITAAEATDVLVATAREGKAEASELAPQFGRLIPIAAELGISFDQLGGGMAFLTKASGDTSLAATQLSGVMAKLLEPGVEGAEALEQVGMSAEDLRRAVREKGLHQALLDLRDNLEANGLQLNDFSVDQQFLQGALQLTGASAQDAAEIFAALEDSAGSTEDAFARWAESMGAQNAQAFADLQVAMIRFGEVLAPIASDVLGFVGDIANAFSNLPDGAQKAILAIAGIVAALGPLMSIGGRVITVYSMLSKAMINWAVPANAASGSLLGVNTAASTATVGVGRLAVAFHALSKAALVIGALVALREVMQGLSEDAGSIDVTGLEGELIDLAETGRIAGEELDEVFAGVTEVPGDPQEFEAFLDRLEKVDDALANLAARDPEAAAAAFDAIKERLEEIGLSREAEEVLDDYSTAAQAAENASRTGAGGVEEVEAAMDEATAATGEATTALQEYVDQLAATFDPLFGMVSAMQGARDAQSELAAAELELIAARSEHGAGSAEAIAAEERLRDARIGGAQAAIELESAASSLLNAIQNEGLSAAAAADQLMQLALDAGFSGDQALAMAQDLLEAAGAADELGATDPQVNTSAPGAKEARIRINEVKDAANSVPSRRSVNTSAPGAIAARIRMQEVKDAADRVPKDVAIRVHATGDTKLLDRLARRQHGGPVDAGRAYVVGEAGPELFISDEPGRILSAAQSAQYMSAISGPMMSAASFGGGGGAPVMVNISMAGAIISSSYDAQRWVANAWNRALRDGHVNVQSGAVRR